MATTPVLENAEWYAAYHPTTGALTRLVAKAFDWEILHLPEDGLSFRLLLPLPERRNNQVFGELQPVASISPIEQGLRFVWNTVTSAHGGEQPISVTTQVRLVDQALIYETTLTNASALTIESVYSPYLADLRPPPAATQFDALVPMYATLQRWHLWPTFQNLKGYWGVDYPTQFSGPLTAAPNAPFILLAGGHGGLCASLAEATTEVVAWHTELRPGYDTALHMTSSPGIGPSDGHVPELATVDGQPVTTRFAAVHLPFIQPGETRALPTIALEPYTGDWLAGADRYRVRRRTWSLPPSAPPAWVSEPHAWQQIQLNSPEDDLRYTYADLVNIGQDCARGGVRAIQIVGWNAGGQDASNPAHDPDPRLGTVDEFKAAIRAIQALGVKVILFTKFTWADTSTAWFREELHRSAIKDPRGGLYHHPGYQYQTATQLLDINTHRFTPMCFLSEDYLRMCEQEFAKVLDLGADGMLFDECVWHGPALACFDPAHGHRVGASVFGNDNELIRRFTQMAAARGQEFLMAGEACYDGQMAVYHFSYLRSEDIHHLPLTRYLHPQVPLMTAVTGFDDRNMINQCLLYRYIISYEPAFFKGRLNAMPHTVAYGQQMDALRAELRSYLWDGDFRNTQGAEVTTDTGEPHHPYTVFVQRTTGQHAVAIANYADAPVTVTARLTDGHPLSRYRLVDADAWQELHGAIIVPPRSAAVVV